MPQKDFPDFTSMKDFHKVLQKDFPDFTTMKDFTKMPQKDFPDYHTMKDSHKMLEKDFHFLEEFVFRRKPRIMIPAPMKSISWEDMDGMLQNIKLSLIRRFHSVSSARKREKNNELFVKHLGRGGRASNFQKQSLLQVNNNYTMSFTYLHPDK